MDAGPAESGVVYDAGVDATVTDAGPSDPAFMLGADITWTQQDVAGGATYVDNGTTKPILQLLRDHGVNFIRMRTFVDPTQPAPNPAGGTFAPYSTQGFGDLTHTIAYGQQIKAAGMGFLLDLHYSDTWADPGKQIKPSAWANDNIAAAVTDLHDYTLAAIQALVAAGARPDMVQVGNEITPGLLTSPGTALGPISNWPQLAKLLNAGIAAVHQVDPTIKIMIHLDRGGDLASSVNFINSAMRANPTVVFDVFGESCYVAFQGGPGACGPVLTSLANMFPTLKFAVAEYNSDLAPNQTDSEIRQANDIAFNLNQPNRPQGAGAFFWEPTRTPNAQNPGMFTVSGRVYTAIPGCLGQFDQMKTDYGL